MKCYQTVLATAAPALGTHRNATIVGSVQLENTLLEQFRPVAPVQCEGFVASARQLQLGSTADSPVEVASKRQDGRGFASPGGAVEQEVGQLVAKLRECCHTARSSSTYVSSLNGSLQC